MLNGLVVFESVNMYNQYWWVGFTVLLFCNLFSFEEKFVRTPKSQIFYVDLTWNAFLSSYEMYVYVKLKSDWFFGAIIFYPAGWGGMVVIYVLQLFWCFSISCVDLFSGKVACAILKPKVTMQSLVNCYAWISESFLKHLILMLLCYLLLLKDWRKRSCHSIYLAKILFCRKTAFLWVLAAFHLNHFPT